MSGVTVGTGTRVQINGRPFVVREADKPFQNLEYTGIDRTRVEDMERRLKADVLREVDPDISTLGCQHLEARPRPGIGCFTGE